MTAKNNFYIKSLKLYNCRHFSKATKPKGKLSTTAKKNWLLQANEKKDRSVNRRSTVEQISKSRQNIFQRKWEID